ncbi:MAG: outer membrane protein assembly factor BamD [Terriglobia bacterium]
MKRVVYLWLLLLLVSFASWGCFKNSKPDVPTPTGEAEPDKILYEKGIRDIAKGKYEVARLTLQTLLNTYPDSDYKEKAKLAIADSYYKQGGTSGLVQAESEYKDFRTFFPTSDDADDAQMKIAMTHYSQMEKPDRDNTQAKAAERELKAFLQDYPDSPLREEAAQKLRDVQEVLGTANLRVANQYMLTKRYDASIRRVKWTIQDYPDFSRMDDALWVLGQSLEKKKQIPAAGYYYGKIVSEYPSSPFAESAKKRLEELNLPIPEPSPEAIARAKSDKENEKRQSFLGRAAGLVSKKPDVSSARKAGRPAIELGPENRINLDATATPPSTSTTPPPTAPGDIGGGVSAEIVKRPASTQSETANKNTTSEKGATTDTAPASENSSEGKK